MISALERKLRDEFAGHSSEHRVRFQELKDHATRISNDLTQKHTEMNELIARTALQEKVAMDEHRAQLNHQLDAVEQKMHREIAASDARHEAASQQLAQEVRNRERGQTAVYERLEEVDRRGRDANASEFRKLREDLVAEHA